MRVTTVILRDCLREPRLILSTIRKAALHMQAEQTKDDDEASQLYKSSKKTGWSGMQVCLMDKKQDISSKMKDDIILDNRSTLSIFANPVLVEGIRKSKSTLEMATNAGTRLTKNIKILLESSHLFAYSHMISARNLRNFSPCSGFVMYCAVMSSVGQ